MEGEEAMRCELVGVQSVAGKGRGVVARAAVPRGTLVLAEEAAAASLSRGGLCAHCLEALSAATVACSGCDRAVYCSLGCRDAAWGHVHWLECGADDQLVGQAGSLFNLTLRLFLATPPALRQVWTGSAGDDLRRPSDLDLGLLLREPRLNWALAASLPQHKRETSQMDGYGQVLKGLYHCAKAIVASGRAENLQKTRKQLKGAMLVTYCNTFHVYCSGAPNDWGMPEDEEAGSGIYTVASLFNHSCLPNTTRVFRGRTMYLRVVKDLEPGEELCITYGVDAKNEPTALRRQTLENWCFRCQCAEACGNAAWRRREAVFWGLACPACRLGPALANHTADLTWLHLHCLGRQQAGSGASPDTVPLRCLDCGASSVLSASALSELEAGLAVLAQEAPYRRDLDRLLRHLHPGNHSRLRGNWTSALARCFPGRALDRPALCALLAVHQNLVALHQGPFACDVAEDAVAALAMLSRLPPTPDSAHLHAAIAEGLRQEIAAIARAHYGPS